MVHIRLNEREPNPNPHINFTTALQVPVSTPQASGPSSSYTTNTTGTREDPDARQLLRALAAQVRPVMKRHGLSVNSFEEYEYNRVFAGRNWNAGEVVELVLRRIDGSFLPTSWLLNTLCHELAHIKHMNHGRRKGKSTSTTQRTQKKRKPGTRVSSLNKFKGSGQSLDQAVKQGSDGSTFRKRAGSQRAREERALAAERRCRSVLGAGTKKEEEDSEDIDNSDSEEGPGPMPETDSDRRRLLLETSGSDDMLRMKTFMHSFLQASPPAPRRPDPHSNPTKREVEVIEID